MLVGVDVSVRAGATRAKEGSDPVALTGCAHVRDSIMPMPRQMLRPNAASNVNRATAIAAGIPSLVLELWAVVGLPQDKPGKATSGGIRQHVNYVNTSCFSQGLDEARIAEQHGEVKLLAISRQLSAGLGG